ncbi:MAG: hypothetical protein KDC02_17775, partial [Flavobacteriales bacterium]|nr:hypothetical protein [Flavobacteriales bacterium]
RLDARTTGLWANLGRSEGQRDLLARLDAFWCPLVPGSWHTVLYGAARKVDEGIGEGAEATSG